jgi:hypothetical protein
LKQIRALVRTLEVSLGGAGDDGIVDNIETIARTDKSSGDENVPIHATSPEVSRSETSMELKDLAAALANFF